VVFGGRSREWGRLCRHVLNHSNGQSSGDKRQDEK
jgi:hypothetical protein